MPRPPTPTHRRRTRLALGFGLILTALALTLVPARLTRFPAPEPPSTSHLESSITPPNPPLAHGSHPIATPLTPSIPPTTSPPFPRLSPRPPTPPPHPATEPDFAAFLDWAQRLAHLQTTANPADTLPATRLAEGLDLARRRRDDLSDLIRTNPRRALELAIPSSIRALLPDPILGLLEQPVSGRGDLEVLCALPEPGQPATFPPIQRWAVLGENRFEAAVYGRRLGEPTQRDVPLEGIVLDGVMAVAEGNPELELELELAAFGSTPAGTTAGAFAATSASTPASAATESTKRLLFIRVDFSDLVGEPFSSNRTVQLVRELDQFYRENSYGRSGFHPIGAGSAVTPVLRMPRTAASYGSTSASGTLRNDARAAARAAGFDTAAFDYDLTCMGNVPGFRWAGLGFVGAPGAWIRGTSSAGVVAHELGHNYGLTHANFWDTSGDTITGPGASIEYGDKFDTMGAANAGNYHFNARYKRLLGWLQNGEFTVATSNGLYRIHAHDQTNSTTGSRGLQIFANARTNYWVEFRQRFTNNTWLMNGVGLRWTGRGNQESLLLDTTPGTAREKDDSAVLLGRTFSDPLAGIHLTPVAKSSTPPAWIEVMVQRGSFPNNRPPSLRLSASTLSGTTSTTFQFRAEATDPDGDPLAYAWDFGDESASTNTPSLTHRWSTSGDFPVRCIVSDMRGGSAQSTLLVKIGSPSTFVLRGRVLAHGEPVPDARVNAGSGRVTTTDSDGSFLLTGLARGSYTLTASAGSDRFLPVGFSNPLAVSANRSNLDFVVADDSAPRPVTVIAAGSVWRFRDQGSPPLASWNHPDFDDSAWNEGPAILGYGGDKETTTVSFGSDSSRKHITTWFRKSFTLQDTSHIQAARIGLLRDDGAVLFLNGQEIARQNLPAGPLTDQTLASSAMSGSDELTYFDLDLNPARLRPGTNLLAVEIHQASPSSSDIAFDLRLVTDVAPTLAPGIQLTRPLPGDSIIAPGRLVLAAAVGDLAGATLDRVEFLADGRILGTVTTPPLSIVWHDPAPGEYTLEARAVLRGNNPLLSPPVPLQVQDPELNPLLIPRGSRWRYLDTGIAPANTWRDPDFDDNAWLEGRARLGFGEDGEFTLLRFGPDPSRKFVTTWFRHAFDLADLDTITNLVGRLQRDDGAVVYLNGIEVFRLGLAGGPVSPTQLALADVSNDAEQAWTDFPLNRDTLRSGRNLVAVEVHQSNPSSSDLGFDLELLAQRSSIAHPPELQLSRSGMDLILRWDSPSTDWQLESAETVTDLDTPWQPVVATPTNAGFELRLTPSEATRFFRLRRNPTP